MKLGGRRKKRSKEGVRHRVGSATRDEFETSAAPHARRASASAYQPVNITNYPRRYTIASDNSSASEQKYNISSLPPVKLFNNPPIRLKYPTNASLVTECYLKSSSWILCCTLFKYLKMIPTEENNNSGSLLEQIPKAVQPKKHKAKILVWSDLTVDAIDRLNESLNPEYVKNVLAKIFFLDNWKENTKTGIVMDLYYHTLQFAREQNFTREKMSTFFSIIKEIFQVCVETPFGNLDYTFLYFKDLLHCHAVNHPPYSIELFTPSEVRKISEYTVNTFFRHFKMYKYAFTAQIRLDINFSYEGMPTPETQSEESIFAPKTPEEEPEQVIIVTEKEEEDEDVLKAKEELKNLVKNFLTEEAKKIEGKVEDQINSAVEALNSKIDPYLGTTGKQETKGKKK
ncbi:hypothetical protein Btru_026517 [Bulinus truncatus]|nr:hypothetical protein Btru_026517 [Bulinus truncatus]